MWNEMDKDGQYNLDVRLSHERTLEENVDVMIGFASELRKEESSGKVKNRFEGYGVLADAHQGVIKSVKLLKDSMGDLLDSLSTDDSVCVDKTESVVNSLREVIHTATVMAADARRVSKDLYKESWEPTPLEKYQDEQADGFEDPDEE